MENEHLSAEKELNEIQLNGIKGTLLKCVNTITQWKFSLVGVIQTSQQVSCVAIRHCLRSY